MGAQVQLTTHSMNRLAERLLIEQPLEALRVIDGRLGDLTTHLGVETYKDGEACGFKLMYFPSVNNFGVLVTKTVMESPGIPAFHILKTVITVEMYERKFGHVVGQPSYKRAARQSLSPVEYRDWIHKTYGENKTPNDNQLYVVFKCGERRKSIGVKIRPALCEGFKKNERLEDSLAHPGALTRVHETLGKFNLSLEERLFMRFDSEHGRLKMEARFARECPYCHMTPLTTDLPDVKDQKATATL